MTSIGETKPKERYRLPDIPPRELNDLTSANHLTVTGSMHHLIQHFGNPETTIVSGEHYIRLDPSRQGGELRYPDMLIAFDAIPDDYKASNGYIVSEQGKPPDFVLEIASDYTAKVDVEVKPEFYADLGVPEYWRFDETGEFHGTRLAGDRLVEGQYRPIPIQELEEGILQGHSEVLNLHIRWEHGRLEWIDPDTGLSIRTFRDEQRDRFRAEARADSAQARADGAEARADSAQARADSAQARADSAETRADSAETRADSAETRADGAQARADGAETRAANAEARSRELKEELRRLRGDNG